jgi:hypothetical protein
MTIDMPIASSDNHEFPMIIGKANLSLIFPYVQILLSRAEKMAPCLFSDRP